MGRFERRREGKSRDFISGAKSDRRGGPGRRGGSDHKTRRDMQPTKVTCSSCNQECEVPFKPTSNKPLFCTECFSKKGRVDSRGSGRDRDSKSSNKGLDEINKKLDKIMTALDI